MNINNMGTTASARFSDVIIGLGGAGKNLVFNMLKSDWFVRKIIESEQSVKFIIIDTATIEYKEDLRFRNLIEKNIEKISKELDIPNRYIDIEIVCLTDKLNLVGIADLMDEYTIQKAKEEGSINTWWLYDKEKGIDVRAEIKKTGGEDFAHGAYRRRGLTKAVFYKAKAEGAVESSLKLSIGAASTVSLITGAGGGTGAGLVIDIAQHIKDKYQSTILDLFLILPSISEGTHEKTNAYSILSELEYDRLLHGKDALFRNVVLHPIERTGYRGGDLGAYSNKQKELLEFDEMFTYIFYDYYKLMTTNAKTEIGDNLHAYCGYLLATGGIIRYNIEPIKKSKEEISNYLDTLQRSLGFEKELRKEVTTIIESYEELIHEFGDIPHPMQLVVSDMDYVRNRFRNIFDTIIYPQSNTTNPFSLLEYESPKRIIEQLKNYIDQGVDIGEWIEDIKTVDDLKDKVGTLKRVSSNLSTGDVVYKDEADRSILNIIIAVSENMEMSIEQLEKASTINFNGLIVKCELEEQLKEDDLRNSFKNMIKIESGFNWLNDFKIIAQKLNQIGRNIDFSIRTISKEIDELNSKFEENRDKIDDVISLIMPDLNRILDLKKNLKETNTPEIHELNADLIEFCNLINDVYGRGTKEHSKISTDSIKRNKELVSNGISNCSIPESSKNELHIFIDCIENIMKYAYAEKHYMRKIEALSAFDKIMGKKKKFNEHITESKIKYKEYVRKLESISSDFSNCYTPGGLIIPLSIKGYLIDSIEHDLKQITTGIITKLENNKGILISYDSFWSLILNTDGKDELKESVETIIISKLKELSEIVQTIEGKELSNKKQRFELDEINSIYGDIKEIYDIMEQTAIILTDKVNTNFKNAKSTMSELMAKLNEEKGYKRKDLTYISKLNPNPSLMGAIDEIGRKKGNLKQIFESNLVPEDAKKNELIRINEELESLIQRYLIGRYQEYLAIDSVSTIIKDDKNLEIGRWSPSLSYAVINAPHEIINRETQETVEKVMKNVLQTHPTKTKTNIVDDCGDWDVAVSVFLGPVSMDNIHPVKSVGGYRETYQKLTTSNNKLKPTTIFHHTYGLENGVLIRRNKLLSKEKFAILSSREQHGEDVSNEVLDQVYEKIELTEFTKVD